MLHSKSLNDVLSSQLAHYMCHTEKLLVFMRRFIDSFIESMCVACTSLTVGYL